MLVIFSSHFKDFKEGCESTQLTVKMGSGGNVRYFDICEAVSKLDDIESDSLRFFLAMPHQLCGVIARLPCLKHRKTTTHLLQRVFQKLSYPGKITDENTDEDIALMDKNFLTEYKQADSQMLGEGRPQKFKSSANGNLKKLSPLCGALLKSMDWCHLVGGCAVLSIRLTRLKPRGPPKAGTHVTFFSVKY